LYKISVEVEWLESGRDRALSIDGGPMCFSERIEWLAYGRPGRAIRGKWRILDGKEGEWSDLKFGAPKW
jgi:hypothetical protein